MENMSLHSKHIRLSTKKKMLFSLAMNNASTSCCSAKEDMHLLIYKYTFDTGNNVFTRSRHRMPFCQSARLGLQRMKCKYVCRLTNLKLFLIPEILFCLPTYLSSPKVSITGKGLLHLSVCICSKAYPPGVHPCHAELCIVF